jgi:hypothetical protein
MLMRQRTVYKCKEGMTYCVYLETTAFMIAPVMTMQGRIEDKASANCHDRMKARAKPVTNPDRELATRATFSEIAC